MDKTSTEAYVKSQMHHFEKIAAFVDDLGCLLP